MTKLCARGKSAAKRKFKVYPSAYANAYASKICAGKIKDPSGTKRKDFRGPKPAGAKVGMAVTAGSQSGIGRLQKSGLMKANKGGGADYMNTVKPRKRGNPAVVGKVKNLEKRKAGGALMILIGIGKKKKVSKKSQGGDAMDEYSQRPHGEKRKALKTGDFKKYKGDVLPKPKRLKLGGGAMEEKEKRKKQGRKPGRLGGGPRADGVGKPRGIMRRQSSYSGGGLARGGGAAIRGTKFEGIF